MAIEAALRPRTEIQAAADNVTANREIYRQHPKASRHIPRVDGELAALEWVLGLADQSPVTASAGADVTVREELDRERRAATDMLYGRIPAHRAGAMYISGVEETLMWILDESDNEPF